VRNNEVVPAREAVADEAPVDPDQKVEEEDERRHEVDEAHRAEPVLLVRLLGLRDRRRAADDGATAMRLTSGGKL
jgi:hypothetical protein